MEGNAMRLDYPMFENGRYCFKDNDFDDVASMVFKENMPYVLEKPQPVDIDYLAQECYYLNVIKAHITLNGEVLGMMVLKDSPVRYYDLMYRLKNEELKASTMLIDISLGGKKNIGRERFTKAHETSHWFCHRSLHSLDKRPYELRRPTVIACRNTSIERYNYSKNNTWSELDWEEWQADRLAASLLMPKESFIYISQKIIKNYGIRSGILTSGCNIEASRKAISDIADFFIVSKKATQIRLKQLGLLIG